MAEGREGGKVVLLMIAGWFAMRGYRQFHKENGAFDVCVCAHVCVCVCARACVLWRCLSTFACELSRRPVNMGRVTAASQGRGFPTPLPLSLASLWAVLGALRGR